MVSTDSLILFHKSMYVVIQIWHFSHNLATIWVSELQMSFVIFTQIHVNVVYLKFLQMSILKISYCDLVTLTSQCLYYLWLNPGLK